MGGWVGEWMSGSECLGGWVVEWVGGFAVCIFLIDGSGIHYSYTVVYDVQSSRLGQQFLEMLSQHSAKRIKHSKPRPNNYM